MPRRQPLTRDRVVAAAIDLADHAGLDALSMRKLARELGVEAMSLYNHVTSKDDLLDGMVDAVVGEIAIPEPRPGEDWRLAMRRRADSAHAVLRRHPWATLPLVSRVNVGPNMLCYVDATIGCLRAAGFSWDLADRAWNAMDSHIYGFTLQELNFPFEPDAYREAARQYLPLIPEAEYPHLHGMTAEVLSGRHAGVHDFSFGLDLILDGLEGLRTRD